MRHVAAWWSRTCHGENVRNKGDTNSKMRLQAQAMQIVNDYGWPRLLGFPQAPKKKGETANDLGLSLVQVQQAWNHLPEWLKGWDVRWFFGRFTLWLCKNSYWKWPFIVDLPIKIVIFHSYVGLPEGMWRFSEHVRNKHHKRLHSCSQNKVEAISAQSPTEVALTCINLWKKKHGHLPLQFHCNSQKALVKNVSD